MNLIRFPDGTQVPALGQGTWMMAEKPARRADELAALREGVELGLTLIDTAEMYADGESERLVGEAIRGLREKVFLVSKAYPQNASRQRLPQACEASLKRLGTDRLDLYLLHWRGPIPLSETVEAMEKLVVAGKIKRWGVSNLDTADLKELVAAGGSACATDQVLYNLNRRSPEYDLLPWLAGKGIPTMAYSPVEQGRLIDNAQLREVAKGLSATSAQVALAWVLRHSNMITIPRAGHIAHVKENRLAAELHLSASDLAVLDAAFPRPGKRLPLEIL
ncbi:MAG: aldo/keto reductase [Bdellovibrionales bacterium]|nr:aldo/keto reductase [Oligoflexia bacterium]